MANTPRIIVVGGGLAGLAAAMKVAEAGIAVDIFSLVPVKRSHSACAQGGINGAVNTKGEGDSPWIHFYDTVKGGEFINHQPLCKGMAYAAPSIIYMMDRMGVPFNRTPEGNIDFRRFGGTLHHRTAFSGASTGQQLLYALDEQVRRFEAQGLVRKFETHEYLGMVKNGAGVCRGIVAMDQRTMKVEAFEAEAVILATGGPGLVYGRSTNSMTNTGSAAASAYIEGVKYANGEFIQIHPTAIPGSDKLRLMSEAARGEGGRVWVPRTPNDARHPNEIPMEERYYFLEEKYPLFGNLVPRDVASREIYNVVINENLGVDGKDQVYLDLSEKPREFLDTKLGGIMEIYEKFVGDDPREQAMKIFPAVHYSMGGLWVDYAATEEGFIDEGDPRNHMTNVPGFYAAGECEYQYHGANRLGANALLSCIYAGLLSGPSAVAHAANSNGEGEDFATIAKDAVAQWENRFSSIRGMSGSVNPYQLHLELAQHMLDKVLIVRENKQLDETLEAIEDIAARWNDIGLPDDSGVMNQSLAFVHQLWHMIELARIITKGARMRDEFRGSHYKPEFEIQQPADLKPEDFKVYGEAKADPAFDGNWSSVGLKPEHIDYFDAFAKQNDEWLKTTIATPAESGPEISYEPVDIRDIEPIPRKYD